MSHDETVGLGSSAPTISVVVVTKNDPAITNTVDSLRTSVDQGTEIVVVDASVGARDSKQGSVLWCRYQQPLGKTRTIAQQRNLGIQRSSGDIIVFLDSGCIPGEHWLRDLTKLIVSGHENVTVGSTKPAIGSSILDTTLHYANKNGYLSEFSALNVAIRRSVFDRVGEFDEDLGFAEDVDFAWRLQNHKERARFVPEASVTHDWGSSSSQAERAFRYGVGRVRLLRKHPKRLTNLWGIDKPLVAYGAFIAFLPVTFIFWWYPLALVIPAIRATQSRPLATVGWNLCYAAGAWSELLGIHVLKSQRGLK